MDSFDINEQKNLKKYSTKRALHNSSCNCGSCNCNCGGGGSPTTKCSKQAKIIMNNNISKIYSE